MQNHKISIPIAALIIAALCTNMAVSQTKNAADEVLFGERNLGGPRLGVTYITGNGELSQSLGRNGIGRTLSQFGWHFEYQVIPDGGGPSFVIQLVPLVAGVEYGKFIPSATLAMGVRLPEGIEFGLGPNALVTDEGLKSALVMTVGKSFKYGGVSIPVNFVYATNPGGNRFSIIFGYAIKKASK